MKFTEWLDSAKCLGTNPKLYETDSEEVRRLAIRTKEDMARKLCEGCPVMEECAAEALEPLALSTVRAGLWIESNPGPGVRKHYRDTLTAIALGSHAS